jgi:anti-sigma factor RsiW
MDLPDLVAYLDGNLDPTDRRAANRKFSSIFEAAVGDQRQREAGRKERRRLAREEKRRQRDSVEDLEDTDEQRSHREDYLF